ncbi:DMT family transporter [Nocardiopsis sp. CNT-189]|uniref:DMT family transporter n=1 Tax=Nocardiopsis oceanisediminis TaxID=2816862 RepID=UPI003B2C4E6C
MTTALRPPSSWQWRFLLLALVWGASFLLIKIGTTAFTPAQITLGRMAAGALPLLALVLLTGGRLPASPRIWLHLAVSALFLNSIPFTLFGYAEQHIPSALAGICNAATPLFAVVFSMLMLSDERPGPLRLAGLGVGFAGVLVVFGVWAGFGGADGTGMLLALGAALCYGIGTPYLRRTLLTGRPPAEPGGPARPALAAGFGPVELAAAQLLIGTAQMLAATAVLDGAPARVPAGAVLAVAALGVFGTGLAYVLQYRIIADAGATVASTVTYLVPVVAVAAGTLLLGERLSWNEPAGTVLILLGAALTQGVLRPRRRPPEPLPAREAAPAAGPERAPAPSG